MSLFPITSGGSAVISDDGLYRYRLERRLAEPTGDRTACFVMLNPSTADANEDDPTIRRCVGFARDWDCRRLIVVNLYGLRSTDPRRLMAVTDPEGPENLTHVQWAVTEADFTVCAWGGSLPLRMPPAALEWLAGAEAWCLGKTRNGQPRHPLYLRADTSLEMWP